MLPTMFRFIWHSVFREEEFKKITNQKKELPAAALLLTDRDEMCNLYRGPYIYAFYHVSVHLAKQLHKRRFF